MYMYLYVLLYPGMYRSVGINIPGINVSDDAMAWKQFPD